MTKGTSLCLAAVLLVARPATAQSTGSPLCKVGASVVELLLFAPKARFDPADLRSSIIFLAECPSSFIPAFVQVSDNEISEEASGLHRAWVDAVKSAARDGANADLRRLLAVARASVASLGDHSLDEYLDGIFDGLPDLQQGDQHSLDSLIERQVLATFREHSNCGGAACINLSDNVLFLLGIHPTAVLMAMRADSAGAADWLRSVGDESFAGDPDWKERMEAARQAVLGMLAETPAPGFERERRTCTQTLRKIRYRSVD